MNAETLRRAIQLDHAVSDRASQGGLSGYLNRVCIDSRPDPRRFGEIAEPWQWDRVNAILPALEHVAGLRPHYSGPLNFYFGYAKGHDKTSFIARLFNWLLGYARRRLKIYAAAADGDQARLIRDAMHSERALNPWLKRRVQVLMKAAWGSGGQLEILAADAASAQGKLPDVTVLDEVTHWHSKDFFDALFSARDKRPDGVVIVTTNAGIEDSWQWELRETARTSPLWHYFEQPVGRQLASWMNAESIAENRKLLTPSEARRLIDNEWIRPGDADGFITYAEAIACRTLSVGGGTARSRYFAAVDYGPRRDRTALSLIRRDDPPPLTLPNGTLQHADPVFTLADLQCWHQPGGEVQIEDVEKWIERVQLAHSPQFVFDEYQQLATIQKYEKQNYRVERFAPRGGAANYEMAANLRSLIASRRIRWPELRGPTSPHSPVLLSDASSLEDELSHLLLRVTPSGYRFDHKSGKHDDRAVAVGMAALFAVSSPPLAESAAPQPLPPQQQFDFRAPPRRSFFGSR